MRSPVAQRENERILRHLHATVLASPRKVGELTQALGRHRNYLNEIFRGKVQLSVAALLDILHEVGEPPLDFLASALDAFPQPERRLDRIAARQAPESSLRRMEEATAAALAAPAANGAPPGSGDSAELAARLLALPPREQRRRFRAADRYLDPGFTNAYLDEVDTLRYQDPEKAARCARAAVEILGVKLAAAPLERLALQCRGIGIFGSCRRIVDKPAWAAQAILLGLELSRRHRLEAVTAELLERGAYVLLGETEVEGALSLIDEALVLHQVRGDRAGVAKLLIDRGLALSQGQRFPEAQAAFMRAIEGLREVTGIPWRYEFAAHHGLAQIARELGEHELADRLLREAAAHLGERDPVHAAMLVWLRGRLAFDLGRPTEAEEILTRALELLEAQGHADALLVGLDLIEVLLELRKNERIRTLAFQLDAYCRSFPGRPLLEAVSVRVARAVVRGEVNARTVQELRRKLEGGASPRATTPPRVT